MMSEFAAVAMNDTAVEKCRVIREAFSEALTAIKQHVKPGRELALVTTKLQEACMWAVRGVAMDPANQHPTQPGSEATESQLDRAPIGGQRALEPTHGISSSFADLHGLSWSNQLLSGFRSWRQHGDD